MDIKDLSNGLKSFNYQDRENYASFRDAFLRDFPLSCIKDKTLSIERYVIGGEDNDTFCQYLKNDGLLFHPNKLKSQLSDFGIYRNHSGYVYKRTRRNDADSSFQQILSGMKAMVEAAENDDIRGVLASSLPNVSATVKLKILSTYFPERFLQTDSEYVINLLSAILGIDTSNKNTIEKNYLCTKELLTLPEFSTLPYPGLTQYIWSLLEPKYKEAYAKWSKGQHAIGSGATDSYSISITRMSVFYKMNIWGCSNDSILEDLFNKANENQSKSNGTYFGGPSSYGKNNYYSSGIKEFREYISHINPEEQTTTLPTHPSEQPPVPQPPVVENDGSFIDAISEAIASSGLLYSKELIARFTLSLLTKRFLILSGLAGSGKTQLAVAFARSMCADPETQMRVVAVGADWTNREPLLGYPNALSEGEYVLPDSKVLQLLIEATDDPEKPYFLILDEMNLSYVERYFADFLSVMESDENIHLWTPKKDDEDQVMVSTSGKIYVNDSIPLPDNLYIIGTINVDETTYMFSPKVLDRANVIEFKIDHDDMMKYLDHSPKVDVKSINGKTANLAALFVKMSQDDITVDTTSITDTLISFFDELKKVNAEFGYRSAKEIRRFLALADKTNGLGKDEAVDAAIVQKLLPKLHGSYKKLRPVLEAMWAICEPKDDEGKAVPLNKELEALPKDIKYPLSADKIFRMYHGAADNGFTSFAEA